MKISFWDEQEINYIDLGNIAEKDWAYRVLKGENGQLEGNEKSTALRKEDLTDFVKTAGASFGVFKAKIDGSMHYFFMYLDVKQ
jgi:hypothetical protein